MSRMVFLGGTTGLRDYRNACVERLVAHGIPREQLFNPVVEDWTEADQANEDRVKNDPNTLCLYYLGDAAVPQAPGCFMSFYSLNEATMGLYDAPERTVVVFDTSGLLSGAQNRMMKVYADLRARFPTAPIFTSLAEAETWLADHLR